MGKLGRVRRTVLFGGLGSRNDFLEERFGWNRCCGRRVDRRCLHIRVADERRYQTTRHNRALCNGWGMGVPAPEAVSGYSLDAGVRSRTLADSTLGLKLSACTITLIVRVVSVKA